MRGSRSHFIETRRALTLAACTAAMLGCGNMDDGTEDGTGVQPGSIIAGTPLSVDSQGTPLLVSTDPDLFHSACTGTLIRSNWMLTAHHCVTKGALRTGGTQIDPTLLTAHIMNGLNTPRGVRIVRHPTLDVALVQLDAAPAGPDGRTFVNPLFVGSDASLVSTSVFVQGWGENAITQCLDSSGNTAPAGTGIGVLRYMTDLVNQMTSSSLYRLLPNNGQILWEGDSGSTPFSFVNGFRRPTGVASNVNCTQSPLQVTEAFFTRSDAFRGWLQGVVGASPSSGPAAGFERSDQATAIVYMESNHIKDLTTGGPAGGGWALGDITANAHAGGISAASNMALHVRADGVNAIYYTDLSLNSRLFEVRLTSTGWVAVDLLSLTGAPNVSAFTQQVYLRNDGATAVVYTATNGHVWELSQAAGSNSWQKTDLTVASGAPTAKPGTPIGYVRGEVNATNAVVFVDTSSHVWELTRTSTGGWSPTDLTLFLGAQNVLRGVRPYSRSDGYSIVLFRTADTHIWEMALDPSNSFWGLADLSRLTGCPNPDSSLGDPHPYVRADGINSLLYRGGDSHLYELSLETVGWQCNDLTVFTGAPTIGSTGLGGSAGPNGFVGSDRKSHVVFRSSDRHVWDLTLPIGGSWSAADLTSTVGGL